eukprot:9075057-Alexandrium_andersonii.AAC.1
MVRDNSLPPERAVWQTEEERESRAQVERLEEYFGVTVEECLRAFRRHVAAHRARCLQLAVSGATGGYVDLPGQPGGSASAREFREGAPRKPAPPASYAARAEERGVAVARARLANAAKLEATLLSPLGVPRPMRREAFN